MRLSLDTPTDPGAYAFTHRVRVRFAETDAMGIVHHSRYLPYLEETRVEYLRHIAHPYHELRADGVELAVVEAWVGYRRPLRFDDAVDVHLRIGAMTPATFQIGYLLTVADAAGTSVTAATAVTVHGAVTGDGRPTRLPHWMCELA